MPRRMPAPNVCGGGHDLTGPLLYVHDASQTWDCRSCAADRRRRMRQRRHDAALAAVLAVRPDLPAVEAAWAAGLFEGEGTISVHRSALYTGRYGYQLVVLVTNCDTSVTGYFLSRWGGGIATRRAKGNARAAEIWKATGRRAYGFLHDIEPYVVRQQVRDRIAVARHVVEANRRGSRDVERSEEMGRLWLAMRRLNHRGSQPFIPPTEARAAAEPGP